MVGQGVGFDFVPSRAGGATRILEQDHVKLDAKNVRRLSPRIAPSRSIYNLAASREVHGITVARNILQSYPETQALRLIVVSLLSVR